MDQLWDDKFGDFYPYPTNPILLRYTEPDFTDERISEGIHSTEAALRRIKSLVGNRKLVILLLPFKEQLYDDIVLTHRPELDLTKPKQIVLELCEAYEISCFDLLPARKKFNENKLFWDYDPHFTSLGQFYASIEIEAAMKWYGIMPSD